ncbi:MAG: Gfo/Idh/MocA family oxidoreductase [Parcubacteria group bacterium]|nr:Gfo/Idh/MocA family oxidoreductase [Parcubacteria group bacterium]
MYIFTNNKWKNGFLDYYRDQKNYRIRVLAIKNLEYIGDRLCVVRPMNIKLIFNYIRDIGIAEVYKKIISRLKERSRNEKYISCGIGIILETPNGSKFTKEKIIGFIAPSHPPAMERIVLHETLLFGIEQSRLPHLLENEILSIPVDARAKTEVEMVTKPSFVVNVRERERDEEQRRSGINEKDTARRSDEVGAALSNMEQKSGFGNHLIDWWERLRGWSEYSGEILSEETKEKISRHGSECIYTAQWDNAHHLHLNENEMVTKPSFVANVRERERDEEQRRSGINEKDTARSSDEVGAALSNMEQKSGFGKHLNIPPSETKEFYSHSSPNQRITKKKAVLFGYGHYAKTNIIPHVKPYVDIETVHEIDPTQIYFDQSIQKWDTSPFLRNDEKYDVFFIAGFHHTHAQLSVAALQQNAYAVAEKPIVTNREQLKNLIEEMGRTKGNFFSGFHRRYSPFNDLIKKDLNSSSVRDPISYHCIVFEAPKPPLHWYRWKNSGSEIVTDGCHWIDHFMFLNGYALPSSVTVYVAKNNDIDVSVELENGAFFTMLLTTRGSEYIGFQDYVELRTEDRTVKMINYAQYVAEDKKGVLRKIKMNKLQNYHRMYREIGKKIARGESGETIESVQIPSELILSIEDRVQEQRRRDELP